MDYSNFIKIYHLNIYNDLQQIQHRYNYLSPFNNLCVALPNDSYYDIIDINIIKIVATFCIGVQTYRCNDATRIVKIPKRILS